MSVPPEALPHEALPDVEEWLEAWARAEALDGSWAPQEQPAEAGSLGPIELTPVADVADLLPDQAAVYHRRALAEISGRGARDPLRKTLAHALSHYLQYTRGRLALLFDTLRSRDGLTFAVIPWLLHVDAPNLPGFQRGVDCPHGVRDFDLNPTIEQAARRLFPPPPAEASARTPAETGAIRSLLVMGSAGTIAQTGQSDLDFWVVVDEEAIDDAQYEALEFKLEAIEAWAEGRGLEVHFFLVDPADARRNDFGQVDDADSSGSAQGELLKEEFYRTSVYLVGEVPLWWMVPSTATARDYGRLAETIAAGSPFQGVHFVDLGFIDRIEPAELFGAALWQINKSLHSPFKSLLKMALLARHLDDEQAPLLCNTLKARVLGGTLAAQLTDPYILLLDAISEGLATRQDWQAIQLVRKCFYLKVGLRLSAEEGARTRRERVMRRYVSRWSWPWGLLIELDDLASWPAERADELGRAVRSFMLRVFQYVVRRARSREARIDERDLAVLGRRLYACFAEEPGKVEHLLTYYLDAPRVEEAVELRREPGGWAVLRREHGEAQVPIRVVPDLPSAAVWLTFNGLYSARTSVVVRRHASAGELHRLLGRFSDLFACPDPFSIAPAELTAPRRVVQSALAVNYEVAPPMEALRLAGRWDPLDYGAEGGCLFERVSVIVLDSWGEVFCHAFEGPRSIARALRALVGRGWTLGESPEIVAPAGRWLSLAKGRLTKLLEGVRWGLEDEGRVFAYPICGAFQVFRRLPGGRAQTVIARSRRGLFRLLGMAGGSPQRCQVDPVATGLASLGALLRYREEGVVHIAYWHLKGPGGPRVEVVVHDRAGRLYQTETCRAELLHTLGRLVRRLLLQGCRSLRVLRVRAPACEDVTGEILRKVPAARRAPLELQTPQEIGGRSLRDFVRRAAARVAALGDPDLEIRLLPPPQLPPPQSEIWQDRGLVWSLRLLRAIERQATRARSKARVPERRVPERRVVAR